MEQILLEEAISNHVMKGKSCLMNPRASCAERTGWEVVDLHFTKVSDTVSHNIFIDKTMKYGLDK